jgi:hypothetical protein
VTIILFFAKKFNSVFDAITQGGKYCVFFILIRKKYGIFLKIYSKKNIEKGCENVDSMLKYRMDYISVTAPISGVDAGFI